MKAVKNTISIGIPAFNEERNIGSLLNSLLRQNVISGVINQILIISDASTDGTEKILRSYSDPRIKFIQRETRQGAYNAQNQIINMSNSDILVLLNADILPADSNFIEEIVRPITLDPSVGLTVPTSLTGEPRTSFEKIISHSHKLKQSWYKDIHKGNNLYMCSGIARAFRKEFYKKIVWPLDVPEDAYSYLECVKLGYKFRWVPEAKIIFQTPSNLSDHLKQSTRFFGGRERLIKIFPEAEKEYCIPIAIKIQKTLQFLLRNPLFTTAYAILGGYIYLFGSKDYEAKWKISKSTKESINA